MLYLLKFTYDLSSNLADINSDFDLEQVNHGFNYNADLTSLNFGVIGMPILGLL